MFNQMQTEITESWSSKNQPSWKVKGRDVADPGGDDPDPEITLTKSDPEITLTQSDPEITLAKSDTDQGPNIIHAYLLKVIWESQYI